MTNEKALERPVEPSNPERAEWSDVTQEYVEYLEGVEDHALSLVAAAYEKASGLLPEIDDLACMPKKHAGLLLAERRAAIRNLTPDDAQAALERAKREARNEALREAAGKGDAVAA